MTFSRSEGLGVASANMFENGVFSGIDGQPFRVDGTLGWQLIFAMSFTHDVAVGPCSNLRELDRRRNASH